MSRVRLEGISKRYGRFWALRNVDLDVKEGEFITLLGASGCGKTSCLRTIAGFVRPDQGTVLIGEEDVTRIPPHRRNIGMVFQHYALFPHMTVADNVAYGLLVRRWSRRDIAKEVTSALELVQLAHLAGRYPKELSGGQKQRVALARAVVIKPRILLLDEPLGALDQKLREELQAEIRRVQQVLGITALNVTHDQGEALSMSDRVVVMAHGRVLQAATPSQLYRAPNSLYVANFVGRTNSLAGKVVALDADRSRYVVALDGGGETIEAAMEPSAGFCVGESCVVVFRPEDATCNASEPGNELNGRVSKLTYLGNNWLVSCDLPSAPGAGVCVTVPPAQVLAQGDAVTIRWRGENTLLFRSDAGDEGI